MYIENAAFNPTQMPLRNAINSALVAGESLTDLSHAFVATTTLPSANYSQKPVDHVSESLTVFNGIIKFNQIRLHHENISFKAKSKE